LERILPDLARICFYQRFLEKRSTSLRQLPKEYAEGTSSTSRATKEDNAVEDPLNVKARRGPYPIYSTASSRAMRQAKRRFRYLLLVRAFISFQASCESMSRRLVVSSRKQRGSPNSLCIIIDSKFEPSFDVPSATAMWKNIQRRVAARIDASVFTLASARVR